jgi:hypothetical protein
MAVQLLPTPPPRGLRAEEAFSVVTFTSGWKKGQRRIPVVISVEVRTSHLLSLTRLTTRPRMISKSRA